MMKTRLSEHSGLWICCAIVLAGCTGIIAGCTNGMAPPAPAPMMAEPPSAAPSLTVVTKYGGPVLLTGDTGNVIAIVGSGFMPRQPVELNIDINGVPVNMTGMLEPEPIANDRGAFATTWPMNKRMYGKTVLNKSGLWTITAVDSNGAPLASAPMGICDPKQAKDKREPWCLVPGLLPTKAKGR